MELLNITYRINNKPPQYLLLLYLGKRDNKICGIASQSILDDEKDKIIANKEMLTKIGVTKAIRWLKTHCPRAYNKGYKEIYNNNISINSRHDL